MFCAKCQNDLVECKCSDIDERLASIKPKYVIYRACEKCKKHYARCKCKNPIWTTSDKLKKEGG